MGKYFDYKVAMSYLGGLDSLFRKVAGSFLEVSNYMMSFYQY